MNNKKLIKISGNVSAINKVLKFSSLASKIISMVTLSVVIISAADCFRTIKKA